MPTLSSSFVRLSFAALIVAATVLSLGSMQWTATSDTVSRAPSSAVGFAELRPSDYGVSVAEANPFHSPGVALYVIGLAVAIGGVGVVALDKNIGYLVSLGGGVLGAWGMWLTSDQDAIKGGIIGISVAANALVLVPVLNSVVKASGQALVAKQITAASLVVLSVLVQGMLIAMLFQSHTYNY